jgi:hypothetical protein
VVGIIYSITHRGKNQTHQFEGKASPINMDDIYRKDFLAHLTRSVIKCYHYFKFKMRMGK